MKSLLQIVLFSVCLFVSPATAQEKKTFTSTNGTIVTVHEDDFAGRYEVTSSDSDISVTDGRFGSSFAAIVKDGESLVGPSIYVVFVTDERRNYISARVRGGEEIKDMSHSSEVMSCRGGCSFMQTIIVRPTAAQLEKHTNNGVFEFQIVAAEARNDVIAFPISSIKAVEEVAAQY